LAGGEGARLATNDETDFIWPVFFQLAKALSPELPLHQYETPEEEECAVKLQQSEKKADLERLLQQVKDKIAEYPLCWFV